MIQLTERQQEVYNEGWTYLTGQANYRYLLLYGFAGTGKTVTVTKLLNDYIGESGASVALTAPVNKAVKVLEKTLKINRPVRYSTLHSLLGLKPKINNRTGEMEFIKDYSKPDNTHEVDVVVVDETSMLNDHLFELITSVSHLKIIFVGDHKQLRPIGKDMTGKLAAPFRPEIRKQHRIKVAGLKDIIRQGNTSGIIPLSAAMRKGLYNLNVIDRFSSKYPDILTTNSLDRILELFDSKEYEQDPDYCKALAFTNDTVNNINQKIRERIYGEAARAKLVKGERLVIDKPVIDPLETAVLYTVNDEVEVEDFQVDQVLYEGEPFKVYACRFTDGGYVNILHEDSDKKYLDYVEAMTQIARNESKKGNGGRFWNARRKFMEAFAHTKYSYAITCHKAQGSTYQHTLMAYKDIAYCKNDKDRQALFYTGLTRAAKTVEFLI